MLYAKGIDKHARRQREIRGGTLFLILAITLAILVPLGIFALSYGRIVGSHHEQIKAIEAAALAAAQDLSQIVVEDPDLGFVSLSDYSPVGKATTAADNYYLPVRSINSLIGTVRLDSILADLLDDETMRGCAARDFDKVTAARLRLENVLKTAIQEGGSANDMHGNSIYPLKDAEAAYRANQIRLSGGNSALVDGSMKLSLGCANELVTLTPIPTPNNYAELMPEQQQSGYYKAYTNVPFKGRPYVFAASGKSTSLVDPKEFKADLPELPYCLPAVVKCEAIQQIEYTSESGRKKSTRLKAIACAQPGVVNDNRPFSGGLMFSFPQGSIACATSIKNLLVNGHLAKGPADRTKTSTESDSPPGLLTDIKLPVINSEHAPFGQLMRLALYDWLRRAGPSINVKSFFDALNQPLALDSSPHYEMLSIDRLGVANLKSGALDPLVTPAISQAQWYAVSGLILDEPNNKSFDCFIRDYVWQPGREKGGQHAGEPLELSSNLTNLGAGSPPLGLEEDFAKTLEFSKGPPGGAVRPSYSSQCIAVEVRFRRR